MNGLLFACYLPAVLFGLGGVAYWAVPNHYWIASSYVALLLVLALFAALDVRRVIAMAFGSLVVGVVVAALVDLAAAETISWQAAVLAGSGGRHVLANGVKTYAPERDVVVQEHLRRRDGAVTWSKSLLLSDVFAVAASVRRERRVDGFGLAVRRRGDQNGYSWNWFKRVGGTEFERPRAPGRVSVTLRRESDYEELASVEFLDDVALLYVDDMRKAPGKHSHEVVIRKGSVLRFATLGSVAGASDHVEVDSGLTRDSMVQNSDTNLCTLNPSGR
jgi:hypothetical protein